MVKGLWKTQKGLLTDSSCFPTYEGLEVRVISLTQRLFFFSDGNIYSTIHDRHTWWHSTKPPVPAWTWLLVIELGSLCSRAHLGCVGTNVTQAHSVRRAASPDTNILAVTTRQGPQPEPHQVEQPHGLSLWFSVLYRILLGTVVNGWATDQTNGR